MLAAMAGPDDRAPLSYEVDTSQFTRAVKAPSIRGWRVAWTPDLDGLIPVDEEVRRVVHDAIKVFRSLGARVEAACPAFSEVPDIIRGTRAVTMVSLHADKLPRWREQMQKDLVLDVEHGLALTAREIARSEVLRSVLWQRVQTFMTTRDLLVLPTVAVPPFPVEQPYPTEINGKPLDNYFQWFSLTYGITLTGLPAISVPCGFTRSGLPVGLQIVGRRRREAAVLRAAAAFEAAAPWTAHIPPVVTSLGQGAHPLPRHDWAVSDSPESGGQDRPCPPDSDSASLVYHGWVILAGPQIYLSWETVIPVSVSRLPEEGPGVGGGPGSVTQVAPDGVFEIEGA